MSNTPVLTQDQLAELTAEVNKAIVAGMPKTHTIDQSFVGAFTVQMKPVVEATLTEALKDVNAQVSKDANQKIAHIATKVDELSDLNDFFGDIDKEAFKNFFLAKEAERIKQEKEEEKKADKEGKFFSAKSMKRAGLVVGGIILIAGVAYVVRKVFFSPSGEIEGVDATPAAAPDLEMVANY